MECHRDVLLNEKSKLRTAFPNFVSIVWVVCYRLSSMMGRAFRHHFLSVWPPCVLLEAAFVLSIDLCHSTMDRGAEKI